MNLKTLLLTEATSTKETNQDEGQRTVCECGTQLQNAPIAGVRRLQDEIQLYCASCL